MTDSRYRVENPDGGDLSRLALPAMHDGATQLHVPDAPHRPGVEPRFARFTQQPGDLPRPDPLERYEKLSPHGTGLVRVISDDGDASGPWHPKLAPQTLRLGLEMMVRTRAFDARMLTMQRQGRLSFALESRGEEAVGVAGAMPLESEDLLFPSYRQQGVYLVRGMPLLQMMCQCLGNRHDHCKGRQMPVHYSWKKGNVVSFSSPVGTQFSQAVGAAMATAYRGENHATVAWIGEGTAAQGDFHYALNFASVFQPPVVLKVVNNQWAVSTHRNMASGGKTFADRAQAYGMPGIRVDGNDFLAVYAVTQWAAERARRDGGPTLIELLTYRCGGHSSSDDPRLYRADDEGRLWPGGDPIERLSRHLTNLGEWSDQRQTRLTQAMEQEVVSAFKKAESLGSSTDGPFDPPATMFDDVYEKLPSHLVRQRDELSE